MKKKFVVKILACTIVISTLSGCGDSSQENVAITTQTEDTAAQADEEPAPDETNETAQDAKLYYEISDGMVTLYDKQDDEYVVYEYGLYQRPEVNVNIYRILEIYACDEDRNKTWTINPEWSDVEGVIALDNEEDFVGSIHGDEIYIDYRVYFDGELIDVHKDSQGYISQAVFSVDSTVYHQDSEREVFTKHKDVTIDSEGVLVDMEYTALEDVNISNLSLPCNMPKYTRGGGQKTVSNWYDATTDMMMSELSDSDSGGAVQLDNDIYYSCLDGDICTLEAELIFPIGEVEEGELDRLIYDYGERYKIYFRHLNFTLKKSDSMEASYRYKVALK